MGAHTIRKIGCTGENMKKKESKKEREMQRKRGRER
jgi:hypothetical protein